MCVQPPVPQAHGSHIHSADAVPTGAHGDGEVHSESALFPEVGIPRPINPPVEPQVCHSQGAMQGVWRHGAGEGALQKHGTRSSATRGARHCNAALGAIGRGQVRTPLPYYGPLDRGGVHRATPILRTKRKHTHISDATVDALASEMHTSSTTHYITAMGDPILHSDPSSNDLVAGGDFPT